MEFFFPDSQDQINPYFDFETEEHQPHRVRQRDDVYAHEALTAIPYDGILISKAIVDGSVRGSGKYTQAQRQRIYRLGAHRFFRAEQGGVRLQIMGDCGAFNYADEERPPYTVNEVVDFYQGIGLDRGVSLDHIVFGYLPPAKRRKGVSPEPHWVSRRLLTVELAAEFLREVRARGNPFQPLGVAHGWDPASYQLSVKELQDIGYDRIALGGLVPVKTSDVIEVVAACADVRSPETGFHLLGVTRTEQIPTFSRLGVVSFDSTSAFRQAFMDERDNYYTFDRSYVALRIPQVDGNPSLRRRIRAGEVDQRVALRAERDCLDAIRGFERGHVGVDDTVAALRSYEELYDTKGMDRSDSYRETLEAAPWRECRCGICDQEGINVILFRGSERNKRRGFHNLTVFRRRLDARIDADAQGAK